jgi:hypothetical protein
MGTGSALPIFGSTPNSHTQDRCLCRLCTRREISRDSRILPADSLILFPTTSRTTPHLEYCSANSYENFWSFFLCPSSIESTVRSGTNVERLLATIAFCQCAPHPGPFSTIRENHVCNISSSRGAMPLPCPRSSTCSVIRLIVPISIHSISWCAYWAPTVTNDQTLFSMGQRIVAI